MFQDDRHFRPLRFACIHTLFTRIEALNDTSGVASYDAKKRRNERRNIQHVSSNFTSELFDCHLVLGR